MKNRPLLPPACLLWGLLAMALVHILAPGPALVPGFWRLLGSPLVIAGAVLTVRADALFKRERTEIKPFLPSRLVVTAGPYAVSRHPMYLGFMAILVGAALLAGSAGAMLVAAAMFAVFQACFVLPEERHMLQQFPEEYAAYRRRVRRWI